MCDQACSRVFLSFSYITRRPICLGIEKKRTSYK
jgi:hypothetical protein